MSINDPIFAALIAVVAAITGAVIADIVLIRKDKGNTELLAKDHEQLSKDHSDLSNTITKGRENLSQKLNDMTEDYKKISDDLCELLGH